MKALCACVPALALALTGPAFAEQAPPGPVTPAEVAAALPQVRQSLPMRIDEITQVVAIRSEGTHFIYEVAVSQPVPPARIPEFRRDFQTQAEQRLCAHADTAPFIRRGGGMRHRYSDTTGFLFETRVVSCP